MKGINHLVLGAHSLDQIRQLYAGLGFTLCPSGQHPFGTGNTVIQLHGSYLELLSVTRPQDIVEHAAGSFSFSAFNRDYLARHEGFSILVLDSPDAEKDIRDWHAAGLPTYAPFEFSRQATMSDGNNVTVGFKLAFTSNNTAPWLGLFACQHFRPDYYAQPRYQFHANGAHHLQDVWISGPGALELAPYLKLVAGTLAIPRSEARIDLPTTFGTIILAEPDTFEEAFGVPPPHPEDGPHLCGMTIACDNVDRVPQSMTREVGKRRVVTAANTHDTAIAFAPF